MKDDRVYLEHIMDAFRKVLLYTNGMSLAAFLDDTKTQDACIRQFEIIGEATKRLSMLFRNQFPQVPWRDMAGMRDKLIHDYLQVDLSIVWISITEEAVPLLIEIEAIYKTVAPDEAGTL